MKLCVAVSAIVLLSLTHVSWAAPVSVQVLGPGNKPVAGATVRARFWKGAGGQIGSEFGAAQSVVSDALGLARFEAPDQAASSSEGMIGQAAAWSPRLSLATAVLRAGLNPIVLARSGTARGVVVDGEGKPLGGALVRLARAVPADTRYSTFYPADEKLLGDAFSVRTDAMGAWSLSGLPVRGLVTVELGDEPFARDWATSAIEEDGAPWSLSSALKKAASRAAQPPSALAANPFQRQGNQDGALVARAAASITGRVLDVAGAPVEGASLSASFKVPDYYSVASEPVQTDARGEFRIGRLNAGEFRLSGVLEPREQARGVMRALTVKVSAGASTSTGDIRLIAPGTVTIRVLDEATGRPLDGAMAYARPAKDIETTYNATPLVGEAGKIVLHLAPGEYRVALSQAPEGYYIPEAARGAGEPRVEVLAGADKAIEWKLKKALPLAGRVLDHAGQPVPNVHLQFRSTNPNDYRSFEAAADGAGRWSVSSLGPGGWYMIVREDGWFVDAPRTVSLPREGALDLVLAPIGHLPIGGRVVDGQNAPVAGARVDLKLNQSVWPEQRSVVTGADGTWRVETVPDITRTISISVSRVGYALQRNPVATKTEKTWAASEAVLQKRDSRLAGRVLDAQGQPASGVQVLAASAQALTVTDDQGAWSLDELPGGESEVIAVGARGALALTTGAPNESLNLRLKTPAAPPARDVDGAAQLLEEAWETSRGSKYAARAGLPAPLAAADPDAALALASGGGPEGASEAVLPIVLVMLRGDAGAAQRWAQANLPKAQKPFEREQAMLALAEATVMADPAASARWLLQARATLPEIKDAEERKDSLARLAALAARLKQPEADDLFAQALKASSGGYENLAWTVAPVREDWAVQAIESAIAAAPPQSPYDDGAEGVAATAITRLAAVDLASAKRLLARYSSIKSASTISMDGGRAQVLGARARAGEDAEALAREAEELGYWRARARALTMIAESLPATQKAKQVALMQQALKVAREESGGLMDTELQIVRRLLPLDREAARVELEKMRAQFETPLEEQAEWNSLRTWNIAAWAWLYREFDAVAARVLIERQWARAVAPINQGQEYRWGSMDRLVLAMAPLDIERAQQLASRLPVTEANAPAFTAQRAIAKWLLAEPQERAAQPLEFWRRQERADGRYSSEW